MNERFVFQPHTGINDFLHQLASTPRGLDAEGRVFSEFSSVVDALHHTQAIGSSSVIHTPDGTNIALINIPKGELARAEIEIAHINGFAVF